MVADRYAGGLRLVHSAQWPDSEISVARLGAERVPVGRIVLARYRCRQGHDNRLPIAVNRHTPLEWECRCGQLGQLQLPEPETVAGDPVGRTHWDRVRQRRAPAQLQMLLEARLVELRAGQAGSAGLQTRNRLIG